MAVSGAIGRFVRNAAGEIGADPALRLYGAALAAVHVAVFLFWQDVVSPVRILAPKTPPICWPFFEECASWRVLEPATIDALLHVHLAVALAAGLAFLWQRSSGAAWVLLLAAELFQLVFLVQDYRLRANQHLMSLWATLAFLLVPGRRRVLPLLIVSFYVWAGLLKLDYEWMSGAALQEQRPLFVPESMTAAACVYVVVLELVVVPLLLRRGGALYWAAFAQVVLFHVVSWGVVGFFYPLLMLGIVSIFVLVRVFPAGDAAAGGRQWRNAVLVTAAFSLLQLPPMLMPGDSALTGEGRQLALHMFDAPVMCMPRMTVHWSDGRTESRVLSAAVPVRIHCDPLVYWNLAKEHCRRFASQPGFVTLDLHLNAARRPPEGEPLPALRPVVQLADFCTDPPSYEMWRHNAWIRTE